jgi:hypothetical protein
MAIFDVFFVPFIISIFIIPLPLFFLVNWICRKFMKKIKEKFSRKQFEIFNKYFNLYYGLMLIIVGVGVIFIGFWNADFAFNWLEFNRGQIGIPFIGTFSAGELWNISWFLIIIGVFYSILGGMLIGQIVKTDN